MACPKCGCKVHYQYDSGWDGDQVDENLERCAACGEMFGLDDAADEDDDGDEEPPRQRQPAAAGHHDFDEDAVCRKCGFDGAEWWHWKHMTYEGKAQPEVRQPPCTS